MPTDKVSPFWCSVTEMTQHLDDRERVVLLRAITGVKQPTVSRWKTGIEPIGNKNALRVARSLGCNIHWLQVHEGDPYIGQEDDPFIVEMRAKSDRLSMQDKEELIALVEIKTTRHT